jgi:hypothetical protein
VRSSGPQTDGALTIRLDHLMGAAHADSQPRRCNAVMTLDRTVGRCNIGDVTSIRAEVVA